MESPQSREFHHDHGQPTEWIGQNDEEKTHGKVEISSGYAGCLSGFSHAHEHQSVQHGHERQTETDKKWLDGSKRKKTVIN